MFKKLSFGISALLFLTFLFSCTTKDGNVVSYSTEFGNLLVSSKNFYGAKIFLDYENTGQVTPALLKNIPIGRHVIHLFLSNAKATPDSMVVDIVKGKEETIEFELNKVSSGDLEVITTPDSARIFVDKFNFGFSPQFISGLPEGEYHVRLQKSNYEPVEQTVQISANHFTRINTSLSLLHVVLLEHFSNTDCPPCPEADEIIHTLSVDYGPMLLVTLGYHANFPSVSDPMYLASKEDIDLRMQFFPTMPIPAAFINGSQLNNPLSEQTYRDLIDAQLQETAAAAISFPKFTRGDSLIRGQVEVRALSEILGNNRLYIALVENLVDYPNPPGTNGQKDFEYVLRKFYDTAEGETVTLSVGQKMVRNFSFPLSNEWGRDLSVIAFVQESGTRKVLQCAWTIYPSL